MRYVRGCVCCAAALTLLGPSARAQEAAAPPPDEPAPPAADAGLASRSRLTGDWNGARTRLEDKGFKTSLDFTYTYQNVVSGGVDSPLFDRRSSESENGHTASGNLVFDLDTTKAGMWTGAFIKARVEGRAGKSIIERAGSVSPANIDGLFPNTPGGLDEETWGLTEFTLTQFLSPKFGLFGGLLNTADGDLNGIAGNARGNRTFLNSSFLLSAVETATVPNVTLGGGVIFLPTKSITGMGMIVQSEETATHSPFVSNAGLSFATEWTFRHVIGERPGGQVVGVLYGVNKSRADIAADPRVILGGLLEGSGPPVTDKDSWAVYYNAHQYVVGDDARGFGPFLRAGLSDGDPNPVRWNITGGLGGKGLFPGREADMWGAGVYYIDMSNTGLLEGLRVDDEVGVEAYYAVAITPAAYLTFDAQWIDQALPTADDAVILGLRLRLEF